MKTPIKKLLFTTKSTHWFIVVFLIFSCFSTDKRKPAANIKQASLMSKHNVLISNVNHHDTTFNNGNSIKLDTIAKLITKQDANGNLIAQYYVKLDSTGKEKIHCPCNDFFPDGSLSKEIKLIEGTEFFSTKRWREDGSLWIENYFDTKRNEWVRIFYYNNGRKKQQKIGEKPFQQITKWFENGQKEEEKIPNYNNNGKGIYRRWSETGKLLEEEIFVGEYTKNEISMKLMSGDTTGISNYIQKKMIERQEKKTDIKKSALKKYQRHKWYIRGHTHVSDTESIFLTPVTGMIDTVWYYYACSGDLKWKSALCRIPKAGEYEVRLNPCDCSFTVIKVFKKKQASEYKRQHRKSNSVIIKLINSDGKLYLGEVGNSGELLKVATSVYFTDDCDFDFSAMCYTASTDIAIYEIKALNSNEETNNELILRCSGDVPDKFKIIRCITSFSFIWLDAKPLVVIYDANSGQITLQ